MTKILVIEDYGSLCDDLVECLQYEGYEAIGEANGIDGLHSAEEDPPDLVICDAMMPGITGYEVLQGLRSTPATHNTLSILISAALTPEDKKRAIELGAVAVIPKPFLISELLTVIRTQLPKRSSDQ